MFKNITSVRGISTNNNIVTSVVEKKYSMVYYNLTYNVVMKEVGVYYKYCNYFQDILRIIIIII